MIPCKLLETYKTPQGKTYYLCHRPPFEKEGTLLPNGDIQCVGCKHRK